LTINLRLCLNRYCEPVKDGTQFGIGNVIGDYLPGRSPQAPLINLLDVEGTA
jgi:hypothetical protein